ncbi:putative membrane protein [Exiguobacterium sp. S17]|nr:putative membrane protein [Exiguobacterium sp. S17]
MSEPLGKGRYDVKRIFFYLLFPYILLMRVLYPFIKTEGGMTYALMLFFVPGWILVIEDLLPVSLLLETFISLYLSTSLFTPLYYFESDVRRRRTKPGYVPRNER